MHSQRLSLGKKEERIPPIILGADPTPQRPRKQGDSKERERARPLGPTLRTQVCTTTTYYAFAGLAITANIDRAGKLSWLWTLLGLCPAVRHRSWVELSLALLAFSLLSRVADLAKTTTHSL